MVFTNNHYSYLLFINAYNNKLIFFILIEICSLCKYIGDLFQWLRVSFQIIIQLRSLTTSTDYFECKLETGFITQSRTQSSVKMELFHELMFSKCSLIFLTEVFQKFNSLDSEEAQEENNKSLSFIFSQPVCAIIHSKCKLCTSGKQIYLD